jgi:hypothetical protein
MSQENEETIRRILAAWAQGDFSAGTAELDPQIAYIVRPPFPETAAVLGLAAVAEYMGRFLKGWKRFTVEANELRRVGDTIVVDAVQSGEAMPAAPAPGPVSSCCSRFEAGGSFASKRSSTCVKHSRRPDSRSGDPPSRLMRRNGRPHAWEDVHNEQEAKRRRPRRGA